MKGNAKFTKVSQLRYDSLSQKYQGTSVQVLIIPAFFFRKKGYINFMSKSVRRPSVRAYVRPSVTFLVNVSPPKPLEVATSNFVVE